MFTSTKAEGFCGDHQQDFWNNNLTWNTENPDFSECFQQSVLVFGPCVLFSIIIFINLWTTSKKYAKQNFPWSLIVITKVFVSVILIGLSISELVILAVQRNMHITSPPIVIYCSSSSKVVVHVLALCLIIVNKKHAIKSSTVLTLFWFIMSVCGVIMHWSTLKGILYQTYSPEQNFNYIMDMIYFPLIYVQFFLSLFSDIVTQKLTEDPFEDVPIFSFATFHWFNHYIFSGMRKLLSSEDFAPLPKRLRTETVWPKFADKIKRSEKHLSKDSKANEVSVLKIISAVIRTSCRNFIFAVLFQFVIIATEFAPPLVLDLLISFMSGTEYMWKGFFYVILLCLIDLIGKSAFAISFFYSAAVSLQMKSALASAVYRKAVRLSSTARKGYTCGEMINLLSVDLEKIESFLYYFQNIFVSPISILISLFLLWQYLGPSCLAGVLVFCLLLVLNTFVIRKGSTYQLKQMETKDSRLKFFTEILSGIKVLKLYAWEIPFMKKITDIRKVEVNLIRIFQFCFSLTSFFWGCAPFMISTLSFTTFLLVDSKNVLDPRTIFVSLNLINILRFNLFDIPMITADLIQVSVSLKRICKFLNSEEYDEDILGNKPDDGETISIRNATFTWEPKEEPTLKDIDFHVKKGNLIAVIGPVGSGKSSLLSAVLGEMCKISGNIDVEGSYAYVPQQAWILNRTVRDNILFVKSMNKKKYNKVLEACSLNSDLEILPANDNTEIGEKGVNLSGGQKQRISLARAIYHDADIYLLDDPLSAVDAHVGKHIFKHVIGKSGLLNQKTRILVTHNISYLHQVDCIYTLRDGKIEEKGTYDELMEHNGLFAELIQEFANVKSITKSGDAPAGFGDNGPIVYPLSSAERQVSIQSAKSITASLESISATGGTLIEDEKMQVGKVKIEAFINYVKNMGWLILACIIMGYLGREVFEITGNVWLSKWSNDPPLPDGSVDVPLRNRRLGVYAGVGLSQCIAILFGGLSLAVGAARASKLFHNHMLDSVMRSPMSFFDTTPLGRIINRFGRDIDDIDSEIPMNVDSWLVCLFSVMGTVIVIGISTPLFLAFFVPVLGLYYLIQKYYLVISRQLKRLQSVARSPVYSHFTETVQGSSSIMAYKVQKQFHLKFEEKLDKSLMFRFYWSTSNRWLQWRLSLIGNIIVLIAGILAVNARGYLDASVLALSLTYAFSVNPALLWLVRTGTELENKSVSVERVDEYSDLPSEAPWDIPESSPGSSWPNIGSILLKNYSTRYREGLDLSLQNVNLEISDCEKVGIVGRTGAGKSSLTLALFRILEPVSGSIFIDDTDISKIGLHQLRSKLTVIPQDPVLFTGHLRLNLDPNESHTDEELWSSLEHANLKAFVMALPEGLQHEISEGGGNLSVGQRQLVCLARALLKKTKILILDEATAAVDVETDQLIQNTIRNEFKNHTVITVAHRLNTIMDYDRIVVMDVGQVVEDGCPTDLLKDQNSKFYSMAKDAGVI